MKSGTKNMKRECNSRKKDNCPIYRNNLVAFNTYEATVSATNQTNI